MTKNFYGHSRWMWPTMMLNSQRRFCQREPLAHERCALAVVSSGLFGRSGAE